MIKNDINVLLEDGLRDKLCFFLIFIRS